MAVRAIVLALALLIAGPAFAACPPDSRIAEWVLGAGRCLAAATFGVDTAGAQPTLVVVVHGDISDGGLATYHVAFARALAQPGVVAVALTRPGYASEPGRVSGGSTLGRQDNYTPGNVAAVGAAVAELRRHYRARRVVYVGHSGGAAVGGVLIGKQPGLIDIAVLVSCPCDIARWRRERWRDQWRYSESPSRYLARVPLTTSVVAITGSRDHNTAQRLAEDYVRGLARRGVDARFIAVEGAAHGFSGLAAATAEAVTSAMF
jgi:pimeloyl-ACP methyl ester carboxylesterase